VSDKNFKVKSGLQVPSLTTAGPVTTDSSGNVTSSATLPITQGGTGQTSAGNALNALLPLQTSQDNKFLQTNGVSTQWTIPQQQTSTDGTVGYKIYSGTVTPSSPATGDIWIDQTTGNGIQLVRWRKTVASATTTVTGLDDNNLTLSYTSGNEQVYINGTLITRGQDYTATNGTSVVLTQAAEIGDTLEIFGNPLFSVTDTYTQAQSNSLYLSKLESPNKNFVINGAFDIWQRGTSFSANNNTLLYTADRWALWCEGGATLPITVTQQPANLTGFTYCARVARNSSFVGGSGRQYIGRSFESLNDVVPWQGKTLTLSFYARAGSGYSSAGNILWTYFTSGTGIDTGFTAEPGSSSVYTQNNILTTNWQRYTLVVPVPSGNTAARVFFSSAPTGSSSTNDYFEVTGVQIEIGSVATPFSRARGDLQGELAACQRYFERIGQNSFSPYGTGLCGSTTTARVNVTCQPKRVLVSVTYGAANTFEVWNSSFAGVTVTGISSVAVNRSQANVGITVASGLVAGNSTILIDGGTGNSYIDFSAEL
jgi:hypothetical protein